MDQEDISNLFLSQNSAQNIFLQAGSSDTPQRFLLLQHLDCFKVHVYRCIQHETNAACLVAFLFARESLSQQKTRIYCLLQMKQWTLSILSIIYQSQSDKLAGPIYSLILAYRQYISNEVTITKSTLKNPVWFRLFSYCLQMLFCEKIFAGQLFHRYWIWHIWNSVITVIQFRCRVFIYMLPR